MPEDELPDELEQRRRKRADASNTSKHGSNDTNKSELAKHYIGGRRLFRAGEKVSCKIVAPELGGYKVVFEGNFPAFLPTDRQYQLGDISHANYVCENGARHLVQPLLSNSMMIERKNTSDCDEDK